MTSFLILKSDQFLWPFVYTA